MQEVSHLSLDGREQIRMPVSKRIHGNAGDKIQIIPVLGVIDGTPLAPHQADGEPGIGIHDRPSGTLLQIFSQHTGEISRGKRRI